jgi:flagellar hook protein FlgE
MDQDWDGDNGSNIYLASGSYQHQTTLKVYDSLGTTHDLTVYFDPDPVTANAWDYIVTSDPTEDMRGGSGDGLGLLARGTVTFNTNGTPTGMTMSTYNGAAGDDPAVAGDWSAGDNSSGYYQFMPSFISGTSMTVDLNLGLRYNTSTLNWEPESLSSTQYSSSSTTVFQAANGYGAGALQSISVGTDGVITGQYSNGEVIPLYQVTLAKFQNEQGMYKEGGNLFRETRLSGEPVTGAPGTNGLGSISPNSLEQSNVDIATEFVKMITTQRGFQANSKIITVTDQMLAELIALKR